VKDLSTDCVLYNQDDIICDNVVVVPKNTVLSVALQKIVAWVCTRLSEIENFFVIKNVGNGAGVYKGTSLIGEKELKSLTSTNSSVIITPGTNTIDFSVNIPEPQEICITSADDSVTIVQDFDTGCFDLEVNFPPADKTCVVSTDGSVTVSSDPIGCVDLSVNFDELCIEGDIGINVVYRAGCFLISTTLDGSETKVEAGTNITVTGTGTITNPYIINSQIPLSQQWQQYDIKEVDLPNATAAAYITANFDSTGLGINERLGWAICNGNNGTKNRMGRTSIGYNPVNYLIGDIGGSKDAVLVAHGHTFVSSSDDTDSNYGNFITTDNNEPAGLNGPGHGANSLSIEGVSGIDKNMQPYIVTLIIQKI
jgi:hypothetical protein